MKLFIHHEWADKTEVILADDIKEAVKLVTEEYRFLKIKYLDKNSACLEVEPEVYTYVEEYCGKCIECKSELDISNMLLKKLKNSCK